MYRFMFAVLQTGSSKIYQPTLPIAVIESIDIMTKYCCGEKRPALSMDVLQRCSHAHWFTTRRQSSKIFSYSETR